LLSIVVILTSAGGEKLLSINKWDAEVNTIRLLTIFALLVIISINDLIYLFFALEVYSLAAYILIGYRGKISVFSGEAALKYFILGTVFSIIMGYSIGLVYWETGLTNFTHLEVYLNLIVELPASKELSLDLISFAIILFLISLFFKLASAPFHFWAPDVYDGAPTSTTYFLFVIPKVALISILIKLSFLCSLYISFIALVISGVLSLIIGGLGGLFQTKLKRLLTYSMINNNGFFLFALAVPSLYSTVFIIFFLIIYSVSLLGLFTSIISLRLQTNYVSLKNIWSWTSLFFINKAQSIATALLLFSSAGIPPLVGFISKFLILFILILNFTNLHYLIIIALLVAPLSCFYYIRIIKVMAFTKKQNWLFLHPLSAVAAYTLSLTVMSLFVFFISSGLVINLIILMLL
jgi:proton-translocating NADH-quinone oxidoreductase chain N